MIDRNCSVAELAVRLSAALVVATIYSRHPTWQQKRSRLSSINRARPRHYTADMDISRVDLPSVCQRAADKALAVVRLWWPAAAYPDPKECNFFEPSGVALLHVDLDHVWVTPGDSGGGQTEYNVDTRAELFWEAQGGRIVYEGRDMHIMSAVNLRINGKHVRRSADRLARTAGIPAVRGGPEPTIGPAQLWKGCPFLAILNLPGQPAQSAPFLLTFSSALIGGQTFTETYHRELATGAALVIGMPQRFVCGEGDGMLVWEGAGGKLMQVEYTACEWVNPDLEKGVWLLQAGFLDSCAQQLTPRTQAAPLLPRGIVAYEGVALLPAMVRRRDGEVVCRVPGCGKTLPLGRMRIHIAFHLHSETLHPLAVAFAGSPAVSSACGAYRGGSHRRSRFLAQTGFFVSLACGQPASRACRQCLLSAPSRVAAGNGGTTCATTASSNTRTTSCLTSAPRNGTGARRS